MVRYALAAIAEGAMNLHWASRKKDQNYFRSSDPDMSGFMCASRRLLVHLTDDRRRFIRAIRVWTIYGFQSKNRFPK